MSTAADLLILQDRIKRDPAGYSSEFQQQLLHFQSQFEIFQLKPSKDHKEFLHLVKFLAAVAPNYPDDLRNFPSQISELLEKNATILQPDLRKTLVKSLILMRNRNLLSPTSLLSLFFKLFKCPDKSLRSLLRNHIISDISRENNRKKSVELNRSLQNFMYSMFQQDSPSAVAPRESLAVLIELFKNGVWNDQKTVNVISLGIFSKDAKMISLTLNFFLRPLKSSDSDDEEEEKLPTKKQVLQQYDKKMVKKTKARKRKLDTKLKELEKKRKEKLRNEVDDTLHYNRAALTLLNDPQGYAEKVFGVLRQSNHSFETRIGMMNLISRLITANQLMINNFYSFMQKYTQPHQQYITQILAILAQSIHHLVTPEIVEPLIRHIACTFVADRRPPEVIAIGINTIREICLRSPLVMNSTLLKDLIQYRHNKNKGVMMAARSLIEVFRAINPMLLPRKDRGKDTDLSVKPKEFGHRSVLNKIDGTEYINSENSDDSENSWETVSGSEESDNEESNLINTTETDNDQEDDISTEANEDVEDFIEIGEDEVDENNDETAEINDENENLEDYDNNEEEEDDENNDEEFNDNEDDNINEEIIDDENNNDENNDENDADVDEGESDFIDIGSDREDVNNNEDTVEDREANTDKIHTRIETMKILTDEDWEKIRRRQDRKRSSSVLLEDDEDVDVDKITGEFVKKRRMTREERDQARQDHREEMKALKKGFTYGKKKG
jgi:protein SDA1